METDTECRIQHLHDFLSKHCSISESLGVLLTDLKVKSPSAFCSAQDGKLCSSEGELHFPGRPEQFYQNHQLCVWTLFVPEGNYTWLCFFPFFCDYDSLSVCSKDDRLVGKFCGGDLALPLLIGSNSIRLKFVPNDEDYGTRFSITYKALTPDILPGLANSSQLR
ncbi:ovochymase-2 isoform X1 [Zonotrichia leucophrys gambelii]|uniref:ovochymase-2 isoform X1 n=1 Tax=Zonotrichia leucophrys gambelii TaxID=257770 RepID=UPI0031401FFC